MQLSDRVTGGSIAALGAGAAYGGSLLPPVPGQAIGPNVFPLVVGLGLVGCGALIALGVGRGFEEEARADFAEHGGPAEIAATPRHPWFGLRALLPPAVLLFYAAFVEALGFVPTAALLVLVMAKALGASWRLAAPLAFLGPVAVHLVFYKLLRVPLPGGLLPMPW